VADIVRVQNVSRDRYTNPTKKMTDCIRQTFKTYGFRTKNDRTSVADGSCVCVFTVEPHSPMVDQALVVKDVRRILSDKGISTISVESQSGERFEAHRITFMFDTSNDRYYPDEGHQRQSHDRHGLLREDMVHQPPRHYQARYSNNATPNGRSFCYEDMLGEARQSSRSVTGGYQRRQYTRTEETDDEYALEDSSSVSTDSYDSDRASYTPGDVNPSHHTSRNRHPSVTMLRSKKDKAKQGGHSQTVFIRVAMFVILVMVGLFLVYM
jgi:hypothetical protein